MSMPETPTRKYGSTFLVTTISKSRGTRYAKNADALAEDA